MVAALALALSLAARLSRAQTPTVVFSGGAASNAQGSYTGGLDLSSYAIYNTGDSPYFAEVQVGWTASDRVGQEAYIYDWVYYPEVLDQNYSAAPTSYAVWNVTVTMPSGYTVNAGDTPTLEVYWSNTGSVTVSTLLDGYMTDSPYSYFVNGSGDISGDMVSVSTVSDDLTGYLYATDSAYGSSGTQTPTTTVNLTPYITGSGGVYTGTLTTPTTSWSMSGEVDATNVGDDNTASVAGPTTLIVTGVTFSSS